MESNQTYKLLHSKRNHKQNEKTDNLHRTGSKYLQTTDRQGLNFQNIQMAHTTQQQQRPNSLIENGQN